MKEGSIRYSGKARVVGDHINTDYIISSRRKRDTLDEKALAQYLMEDIDPSFAGKVRSGDLLVAGENFGCGSAMEIAACVIRGAGIPVVMAKSFARAFYRNGINTGLLLVICDTRDIEDEDDLTVTLGGVNISIRDDTKNKTIEAADFPSALLPILTAGGLVKYMRRKDATS